MNQEDTRAPGHPSGQPAEPFTEGTDCVAESRPDRNPSRRLDWSGAVVIRLEIRISLGFDRVQRLAFSRFVVDEVQNRSLQMQADLIRIGR